MTMDFSNRISSFKEWLNTPKTINENEVTIEVDWWEDCFNKVMNQIEQECNGILIMDKVKEFVTKKNVILGRDYGLGIGTCVKEHIKDLIFQNQWQCLLVDEEGCSVDDNASNHSLGFTIEALADEIYQSIIKKTEECDFANVIVLDESQKVKTFGQYIEEAYYREEPTTNYVPKSEEVEQLEEFANNKEKRTEIIKAWTNIKDHPKAKDMEAEVGSAFEPEDLDEELGAAFDAIGEGGFIYCSYEHTFWIRHKGLLIRVM